MADLLVDRRTLGELGTNCYFLCNSDTRETLIVDPADNMPAIMTQIQTKNYKPAAVVLTHGHFDHMLAAAEVRDKYGIQIYIMEEEMELATDSYQNLSARFIGPFGLKADVGMWDGECLELNGFSFRVIHTPGHTKGSCCLYFEKEKILISGDTLFHHSVGRTDFPTGNTSQLYRSIAEKLLVLPETVTVYPGHGDESDIADEKRFFAQYGY